MQQFLAEQTWRHAVFPAEKLSKIVLIVELKFFGDFIDFQIPVAEHLFGTIA